MLLKKGASFFNVFLFLGAWSATKLPQMLFEISQLGAKFAAATRVACAAGGFQGRVWELKRVFYI